MVNNFTAAVFGLRPNKGVVNSQLAKCVTQIQFVNEAAKTHTTFTHANCPKQGTNRKTYK